MSRGCDLGVKRSKSPVSMLTLAQRRQWVVRLAFGWGWFYNVEPTLGQRILSTLSEDV